MKQSPAHPQSQRGIMMIEVLVTILIVSLGLLGIAALFARSQQFGDEAYQRFQALQIARQLGEAMAANPTEAANNASSAYVTPQVTLAYSAPGGASTQVVSDMTNFRNALVGAGLATDKLALVGAMGCIDYIDQSTDATNPTTFYRISVAWTGRQSTGAPQAGASACGAGIVDGGDAGLRRVVSYDVQIQAL